jgi:hypothetical protein
MAVANKPKPRELCPECYKGGVENDLIYRPGAKFSHFCTAGHQWEDRDVLAAALLEMGRTRRAAAPPPVPEPPKEEASAPPDTRMRIEEVDRLRLESVLGKFTDSSSLFGAVFAMNEQMKDMRERVERAEARVLSGQIRKIGGDVPITLMIPERHVQPLEDVAKSGQMSLERYMNSRVEDGLDNLWFY